MPPPLPPAEKTPLVVLQWTEKAQKSLEVVTLVKQRLEEYHVIVMPSGAHDILILSASQEALEEEAERSHLVKAREVGTDEVVMDHFEKKFRKEFIPPSRSRGPYGLFTVHERAHLTLGIIERIHLAGDSQLATLLQGPEKVDPGHPVALKFALESNGWIDIMTALHIDDHKVEVQRKTWFPIWNLTPPVDLIQEYYGPSIGFYFAFMGFLGRWLAFLGILGLSTLMWRLYREEGIDDDQYTPLYGLVCFLWAVLLLKFWDREEHMLAHRWGTLDITTLVDDHEDDYSLSTSNAAHGRPEFKGRLRTSPVTKLPELYYSPFRRKLSYVFSGIVTSIMLSIAFFIMIMSLNLQGYIMPRRSYHPFHYPFLASMARPGEMFDPATLMCYVPVVMHVICILTLNTIYRSIAAKLTDWENHRTQEAYNNSLILKRFLFEAFDCYVVLFYLAFYERDVDRLRMELITVFNVDSFRRLFLEVIVPMALHRKARDNEHPQDLDLDEYEPFDDYMEILIQFGYVTLFASAYPLASLVFCIAVAIEVRSDCYKLTYVCQKPNSERVNSIGMWKSLLKCMVWMSCLTNCLLFGYTSEQMMYFLPVFYTEDETGDAQLAHDKGWIAIFIIFGLERVLIIIGLTLQNLIPAVPEELKIQLHRRRFLLSTMMKKTQ